MRFGVQLPHFGALASLPGSVALARRAEALGFDSVWVGDHVAYPATLADRFGRDFYEPLSTLALVAGATTRVILGTAVVVLPYHHPLLLARTLATIAAAAPGRLAVGVGVGWLAEEFAALGAPFTERGAVADEALQVIRAVWSRERASFAGRFFRFDDVLIAPRPAPVPPLLVGGNTARARRRAAEQGDGWLPIWHAPTGRGFTPPALATEVAALRERRPGLEVVALMPLALVEGPGAPVAPEPLVGPRAALVDLLGRYREAGLDHVILSPYYGLPADALPRSLAAVEDLLAAFAADVRAKT
jgi:probable F420-dependent oxidoreductase